MNGALQIGIGKHHRLARTSALIILSLFLNACCASLPESPCQHAARHNGTETPDMPREEPQTSVLKVRGGAHLDGLHPELVRRARLLYEQAEEEGILLRFISGYRRYHKRRRAKRGKSLASWHNFGAAFDLILHERKSMRDALKHMRNDAQRWDRVGQLGRRLGLTWGKPWGVKEIFHFEWHPGHPDALRAPAFKRLTRVTGTRVEHYQRAWDLFEVK